MVKVLLEGVFSIGWSINCLNIECDFLSFNYLCPCSDLCCL